MNNDHELSDDAHAVIREAVERMLTVLRRLGQRPPRLEYRHGRIRRLAGF